MGSAGRLYCPKAGRRAEPAVVGADFLVSAGGEHAPVV